MDSEECKFHDMVINIVNVGYGYSSNVNKPFYPVIIFHNLPIGKIRSIPAIESHAFSLVVFENLPNNFYKN